jgi:enterochelin esterase-like enzyme
MKKYLIFCLFWGIILQISAQQTLKNVQEKSFEITQIHDKVFSKHLGREVAITLIYPINYNAPLPLLIFNDGQDFDALHMKNTIHQLLTTQQATPFFCVGIHANQERLQEYGTAKQADYKNRGAKAQQHTDFIVQELIPYLEAHYPLQHHNRVMAGFSLGGLSAMDIGWHHPEVFTKIGVFSGALWWRQKSEEEGYTDENDRIIHNLVRKGKYHKSLKFWFEAGSDDETSDRNHNGIIDAIDDTLDLMKELENKGYAIPNDIVYRQVEGGQHNQHTWGQVMPEFLSWAFSNTK